MYIWFEFDEDNVHDRHLRFLCKPLGVVCVWYRVVLVNTQWRRRFVDDDVVFSHSVSENALR